MVRWIIYSLITLTLWGLWGIVLKLASETLAGWRSVYVATNSAILVVLVMVFLTSKGSLYINPKGYLIGFVAGLMGTLGYIFLVLSLEAGGKASIIVALTGVYPALTALLSRYLLKETLTLHQWIGVALAVIAVVLLSIETKGG